MHQAAGEGLVVALPSSHPLRGSKSTAAGAGVSGLRREDACYLELDAPQLVSPILLSTRLLDASEDIRAMLVRIYRLHNEQTLPATRRAKNSGRPHRMHADVAPM
ncbi:hypothetical protein [Ralstonia pseudosolanacearum]|uniref:hypothetical protein n=1 Tax=Ralstonia pseudosolanacearum TaxID=1310165 RepID=UPI001FF7BEA8|nr:hypothetical protein [Ralstonia pseudosolanacearum]